MKYQDRLIPVGVKLNEKGKKIARYHGVRGNAYITQNC